MAGSRRLLVVAVCMVAFCGVARGQQCGGTAILTLTGMDPACAQASTAIAECGAKFQVAVAQTCDVSLQPDLAVANDGTYCQPMRAFQSVSVMNGRFILGRSDLEFYMRPNTEAGVLLMNLRGRVVPPAGGREIPLECNLMYNVTGGTALGIAARGNDALMATSVQGGPVAGVAMGGGGYSGAGLPGQSAVDRFGAYGAAAADDKQGRRKNSAGASTVARYFAAAAGAAGLLLPALL